MASMSENTAEDLNALLSAPAQEVHSADAVAAALSQDQALAGWTVREGRLHTACQTPDFASALMVVNQIGAAAEAADHHPDLELGWGRVAVSLVSHDVSGLTSRDLRMARTVSQILAGEGLAADAVPAED
jgi:4a-hydroxytetrahydrobiopterin dehydratase